MRAGTTPGNSSKSPAVELNCVEVARDLLQVETRLGTPRDREWTGAKILMHWCPCFLQSRFQDSDSLEEQLQSILDTAESYVVSAFASFPTGQA